VLCTISVYYTVVILYCKIVFCDDAAAAADTAADAPTSTKRQTRFRQFLFVSFTGGRQTNYDVSVACVRACELDLSRSCPSPPRSCLGERLQLTYAYRAAPRYNDRASRRCRISLRRTMAM